MQTISDPFNKAFPEFSDILGLYDTVNARSYGKRDPMLQRIKETYVTKTEESKKNNETLRAETEIPSE